MRRQNILILSLPILLLTFNQIASAQSEELQFDFVGGDCKGIDTISSNSTYQRNILTLLSELNTFSSVNLFFTNSSGRAPDSVNGFYLCRPDLPLSTCKACVNTTINTLRKYCLDKKNAIVWYAECMIQYTNNSVTPAKGNGTDPWDFFFSTFNVSQPDVFPTLLSNTMQRLILEAVSPDNPQRFFAIGKANFTVFEEFNGMVLCRPDITEEDCESCLRIALSRIPICCGDLASWTMVLLPNCQLRYDTAPFIFSRNPLSPSSLASTSVAPARAPTPEA